MPRSSTRTSSSSFPSRRKMMASLSYGKFPSKPSLVFASYSATAVETSSLRSSSRASKFLSTMIENRRSRSWYQPCHFSRSMLRSGSGSPSKSIASSRTGMSRTSGSSGGGVGSCAGASTIKVGLSCWVTLRLSQLSIAIDPFLRPHHIAVVDCRHDFALERAACQGRVPAFRRETLRLDRPLDFGVEQDEVTWGAFSE